MTADRGCNIRVLTKNRHAEWELRSSIDALEGLRVRKREELSYERRSTRRAFSQWADHSGYSSAAVVAIDPTDLDLPPEEFGELWATASLGGGGGGGGGAVAEPAIASAHRGAAKARSPALPPSGRKAGGSAPPRPFTAPAGLSTVHSAAARGASAVLGGRRVRAPPSAAAAGRRPARDGEQHMALLLGSPNASRRRLPRPRTVSPSATAAASASIAAAAASGPSLLRLTSSAVPASSAALRIAAERRAPPVAAVGGAGDSGRGGVLGVDERAHELYREDPVMLKRLLRLSRGLPVNPSGQRPGTLHVAYSSHSRKSALRAMTAVRKRGLDERKHVDFYGDVLDRVRTFIDSLQFPKTALPTPSSS